MKKNKNNFEQGVEAKKKKFRNLNRIFTWPVALLFMVVYAVLLFNFLKPREVNDSIYANLMWQFSSERRAGILTQFRNAIKQFDEVVEKNKDNLTTDAIKVTEDNEETKVEFTKFDAYASVPVVVVDLDETILDNTIHQIYMNLENKEFNPSVWHKWVASEQASIYDCALEFVNHVWRNGGMVLLTSNRNHGINGRLGKTGDHITYTRNNLIKRGYPSAFLENYVWWLDGVKDYSEYRLLTKKEERFNYINESGIMYRNLQNIVKTPWEEAESTKKLFDAEGRPKILRTSIVMRIGDDMNDFNDNFTKNAKTLVGNQKKTTNKIVEDYYLDKNIRNLWGKVSNRVSFHVRHDDNKIVKKVWTKNMSLIDVDSLKEYIDNKNFNDLNNSKDIEWFETYALISGNNMYGSWYNNFKSNYGKDKNAMKRAILEYFDKNNGKNIFK